MTEESSAIQAVWNYRAERRRERIEGAPLIGDTLSAKVEQYVKLYVKPRPRWMPEALYRRIMGRLVLYESLPMVTLPPAHLKAQKTQLSHEEKP